MNKAIANFVKGLGIGELNLVNVEKTIWKIFLYKLLQMLIMSNHFLYNDT